VAPTVTPWCLVPGADSIVPPITATYPQPFFFFCDISGKCSRSIHSITINKFFTYCRGSKCHSQSQYSSCGLGGTFTIWEEGSKFIILYS
jgi:hypothetical protein